MTTTATITNECLRPVGPGSATAWRESPRNRGRRVGVHFKADGLRAFIGELIEGRFLDGLSEYDAITCPCSCHSISSRDPTGWRGDPSVLMLMFRVVVHV
jgi:hypothetical protein